MPNPFTSRAHGRPEAISRSRRALRPAHSARTAPAAHFPRARLPLPPQEAPAPGPAPARGAGYWLRKLRKFPQSMAVLVFFIHPSLEPRHGSRRMDGLLPAPTGDQGLPGVLRTSAGQPLGNRLVPWTSCTRSFGTGCVPVSVRAQGHGRRDLKAPGWRSPDRSIRLRMAAPVNGPAGPEADSRSRSAPRPQLIPRVRPCAAHSSRAGVPLPLKEAPAPGPAPARGVGSGPRELRKFPQPMAVLVFFIHSRLKPRHGSGRMDGLLPASTGAWGLPGASRANAVQPLGTAASRGPHAPGLLDAGACLFPPLDKREGGVSCRRPDGRSRDRPVRCRIRLRLSRLAGLKRSPAADPSSAVSSCRAYDRALCVSRGQGSPCLLRKRR